MEIPRDIVLGIAKFLEFSDISKLQVVYANFEMDQFWRDLTRLKFPNQTPEPLRPPRDQFILLESENVWRMAALSELNILCNPDLVQMGDEIVNLGREIERLQKIRMDTILQKEALADHLNKEVQKLTLKSICLKDLAVKDNVSIYQGPFSNYIQIRLAGKGLQDVCQLLDIGKYSEALNMAQKVWGNIPVMSSDIISLTDAYLSKDHLPLYVIFAYSVRGGLDYEVNRMNLENPRLPGRLQKLMKAQSWSLKDLAHNYKIPWIESLRKNRNKLSYKL